MAVGMVVGETLAEPDDPLETEVVLEPRFDLRAVHCRDCGWD